MPRKPKAPEPPKDERRCGNCRHWKWSRETGSAEGECRRYPPAPIVDEEGAMSVYPYTHATEDYCGEHAPVLQ